MSGNVTKSFLDRQVGIISAKTFQRNVTCQNLQKIALSKFQTVKTVGRKGVQTSLDIDPLEWRYILSGTSDGLVAIYDTQNRSGTPKHSADLVGLTSSVGTRTSTSVVQWYPGDNGLFVSSGADGQLKVWDANVLSTPVETFALGKRIYCHHISGINPSCVAVGTETNHVRIVDLRAGSSVQELRGHQSSILSVKWSPNFSFLASGCLGGQVLLWDIRKARNCLMSLDMGNLKGKGASELRSQKSSIAHKGAVNGLAFSNTGRHLVTLGCFDGRIRKWDVLQQGINTKTPFVKMAKKDLKIHLPLVTSGDCTNAENEVIFVPIQADIGILSLGTGQLISKLSGHFRNVTCTSFSPYFHQLYSGSTDRNILVWTPNRTTESAYEQDNDTQSDTILTQDSWSTDESE